MALDRSYVEKGAKLHCGFCPLPGVWVSMAVNSRVENCKKTCSNCQERTKIQTVRWPCKHNGAFHIITYT